MLQVVSLVLVLVLMVPLLVVLASVKLQVLLVLLVLLVPLVLRARPNPKVLQGWQVWVFLAAWHQAQARL
jgi:hypothetical protein